MKPNYLVIGAQKSATSTLCDLIGRHPQGFMTRPKEPYFFSNDEVWARGWAWYESLFAGAQGARAIGEGSTTYTMRWKHPNAAERIAENLPNARLIYIVRNPIDRAVSHYTHLRSRGGREKRPIDRAMREDPWYLDNSLYDHQLSAYRDRFPARNILVLFFEDMKADQRAVARRCYEFLDIDPEFADTLEAPAKRNSSEDAREDTALVSAARRIPFFSALRSALPKGMVGSARRALKRPAPKPQLDHDTRAWMTEQLREDSHRFLIRYGKPADFWGF